MAQRTHTQIAHGRVEREALTEILLRCFPTGVAEHGGHTRLT
jgi:hypothetical protein